MYRLALYELIFLFVVASILGAFNVIPYDPLYLLYSLVFIFVVAWVLNKIFAFCYDAPSNPESTYITAFILTLIITPPSSLVDVHYLALAGWAAAIAIASKYIFAIKEKHIFNPAAIGVVATSLFLGLSANWWISSIWMLPFVLVGGFLLVRKIRRFDMVFAFLLTLITAIVLLSLHNASSIVQILQQTFTETPALFLATVMLTEPLTTPPTRYYRLLYGIIVGFLFAPEVHFGTFYFTPEIALLVGNVFAYAVSPKQKLLLTLKDRVQLAPDTFEFVFSTKRKLKFAPGQYLEWTLAHAKADARGIRRFFTIASSPNDPDIRIGIKFYEPASSFKKKLQSLQKGGTIVASQLAGDFTLPEDKTKKLVFMAGGIGITPFRSMIDYLLDKQEKRDIVLFYSNRTQQDAAYLELLDRAEREIGLQVIPIFTNQPEPANGAEKDFPTAVTQHLVMSTIKDYEDRTFYLSGPRGMVDSFSDLLTQIGVPAYAVKKDFFPGFA